MFPNDDPQREIYEDFRKEFSREDDIILLTYAGIPILEKASPQYDKHSRVFALSL
mgnify:CR=1 FL=1